MMGSVNITIIFHCRYQEGVQDILNLRRILKVILAIPRMCFNDSYENQTGEITATALGINSNVDSVRGEKTIVVDNQNHQNVNESESQ